MTAIPDAALDDRLAFVGISGSGKTFAAGTIVERLLTKKSRVIIIDPLDVWFGLRLDVDGKGDGFPVVIFGGAHGDLALTENAGSIIGETVANMAESCIVSLSELGTKASERRFMLAFLTALYRHTNGEPVHLIFDEADMFCPQRLMDKDGDAARLSGQMETIVRRGRVKGFIPYLITQRPAVLSKDVLSQADGLIAMKLTSSQDRDALGAWIEGQADRAQENDFRAALPRLTVGRGIVWIPGRHILAETTFPAKMTFDSSRTPKRGEKKSGTKLRPLDLSGLRGRLATVEEETKANDPKALRAELAALKRQMANGVARQIVADPAELEKVDNAGYARGHADGVIDGRKSIREAIRTARDALIFACHEVDAATPTAQQAPRAPAAKSASRPQKPDSSQPSSQSDALTGPQRQFLKSMAWWLNMGHAEPARAQVAAIAGWRITSGHLRNVAGTLSTLGLIKYPRPGFFALTPEGKRAAPAPDMGATLHESLRATLTGPQRVAFEALVGVGKSLTREALAIRCGWGPTSGHVRNVLGSLSTLEIIDYPRPGEVDLQDWVTAR